MAEIRLQKLSKVYPNGVQAVDSLDLTVADREFVVLVGPSGCGKTTTLRMVAGLEEPTSGVIRIGDRVVNRDAPKDRDLAMVFQTYALYPHLTVVENLAFGLRVRGLARGDIEQRVRDAARVLGIEDLMGRKPRELSGGQKQRVAVGRAIVREPKAFLFDEPLSNLDARLRVTTRAELKRLHQQLRITTLYVTHDQEEAMTLGDRIVVMNAGKIQQADSPLNTYNQPVNRFVAGFIGTPLMNFFDGSIMMSGAEMVFAEGLPSEATDFARGFRLPVPAQKAGFLTGWVGRPVVLGIRPQNLRLRPIEGVACAALELKVNVVEPLGSDMDVYMSTNLNDHVVARAEAQNSLQTDARVTMYVDPRTVHFFEPGETGMNLCRTIEPSHADA